MTVFDEERFYKQSQLWDLQGRRMCSRKRRIE